jgi:hypothetical protein
MHLGSPRIGFAIQSKQLLKEIQGVTKKCAKDKTCMFLRAPRLTTPLAPIHSSKVIRRSEQCSCRRIMPKRSKQNNCVQWIRRRRRTQEGGGDLQRKHGADYNRKGAGYDEGQVCMQVGGNVGGAQQRVAAGGWGVGGLYMYDRLGDDVQRKSSELMRGKR